jgi:hypothetical protein
MDAIDQATMALYERVRASPRYSPLIHRIESGEAQVLEGPVPRVIVMPGAFHRQYAHTGADGRRVLQLAAELGWPAETVPVPSFGSLAANAEALVQTLRRRPGEPVILVSLSKGGADVRTALTRPTASAEFHDVRTWVNISGIVTGTALVAWLKARPLRCLGVRLLLRCRGQRWAQVEELRRAPDAPLSAPMTLPRTMRAIHVAGFPRASDLSNDWAIRGHARLAPLGPNDGGGILLADLLDLPGEIYPVRRADHYLSPNWNIRPLLLRILREAACAAPTPRPAIRDKPERHAGDDVGDVVLLGRERRIEDESRPDEAE